MRESHNLSCWVVLLVCIVQAQSESQPHFNAKLAEKRRECQVRSFLHISTSHQSLAIAIQCFKLSAWRHQEAQYQDATCSRSACRLFRFDMPAPVLSSTIATGASPHARYRLSAINGDPGAFKRSGTSIINSRKQVRCHSSPFLRDCRWQVGLDG